MRAIALTLLLCGAALTPAWADSITVRNTENGGDGSLREALDDADDGDTILFANDVRGEIQLTEPLDVDHAVAIKGPGADALIVRAGEEGSALDVSADATISGLTVNGGASGIDVQSGKVSLIEIAVRDAAGPGIEVADDAKLTLARSLLADNRGAGLANGGGTITCVNSTISGNAGAGITNADGQITLSNCTIASNKGAGIETGGGQVQARNTLLADNAPSCSGTLVSAGYNLADDASCGLAGTGDQNGVDARLGVLYGNGGRTATMAPGTTSPALNAGDPSGCNDAAGGLLTVDQRGVRRPSGGRCDVGAVEVQATATTGTVVNKILALVDGDPITLYEVKDFTASDVRLREAGGADPNAVLDLLVTKRVIEKEVAAQGIVVSDAEIDRYIGNIRERNGISEEQLDQALAQQGLTREQYRAQIKDELQRAQLINREIRGKVSVSPEEIERYQREHGGGGEDGDSGGGAGGGDEVVISHIVLQIPANADEAQIKEVEAHAEKIYEELDDGADFAEVAQRESQDGAAKAGGKLGTFKKGEMRDELEEAIAGLEPGEFSKPVRTSGGIHIVRLDERIAAGEPATVSDAKRDEIKEKLYAEALEERYNRWLKEDLRQRHHVEIKQ